ncbi:hypothetical protein [Loigolactobacillus backii]|uniref:Uncharacterized protein n=1 Tax=Loigolactobacillus backii TaxID=375175 RepID=A0A192H1H1_9LACO|nr:hypothetical protein [Loigolactobacillus backii]ANK62123.1 hypothetical protein AYR53_04665 [Loigolactobacillus backii]ANK68682.1 hypothetical protein AYR56_00055 [Loigolactobacillus backii]MDA5386685.1 hypothetical protein [Loigolactobacillus backii]MDA5389210.1 hypothetical protein [Loigolactobacillus backii]
MQNDPYFSQDSLIIFNAKTAEEHLTVAKEHLTEQQAKGTAMTGLEKLSRQAALVAANDLNPETIKPESAHGNKLACAKQDYLGQTLYLDDEIYQLGSLLYRKEYAVEFLQYLHYLTLHHSSATGILHLLGSRKVQ